MPVVKKIISTCLSYAPVGPYNQAILAGDTLYVSGLLGLERDASKLVDGGAPEQARQALVHLGNILECAGAKYETVVKTTILLADIVDFPKVNEVYMEFFKSHYPARSTFQVGKLPLNAAVELEAIALVGDVSIQE